MANIFQDKMFVGEAHYQAFDHASVATDLGTSVSSAAWSNSDDAVITISGETIDGNEPLALATAVAAGSSTVTLATTMADGQIIKSQVRIKVVSLGD